MQLQNKQETGEITHYFIPIPKTHPQRKGLSERTAKRRLEKQGWDVWRSELLDVLKEPEIYPNVRRKYEKLILLLQKYHPKELPYLKYLNFVHHGMPDFLCFRKGEFKFVECKLGHEQLSSRQKKTITELQRLGFKVEVLKIAETCTKTIRSSVNLMTGKKIIFAKQMILKKAWR